MALKIRLSRAGAKKRPFYRVVVADSRRPRDGRFLERLGTFDPMLPKDHPERVRLNVERVRHWLDVGALPSDRVARFLGAAEIIPMPAQRNNPQKAQPKAKALERQAARAEKAAAAASAQAEAPAEAAPEEAVPEEAVPEEAVPEEAAPEEAAPRGSCPRGSCSRGGCSRGSCPRRGRPRRDRRRRGWRRRWRGRRESRRLRPHPALMAELPRRSSRHRQGKVGRRRSASGGSWVPTACAASCACRAMRRTRTTSPPTAR